MRTVGMVCLVVCLCPAARGYGQLLGSKSAMVEFRGRVIDGGTSDYAGLVIEVANLRDRTIEDHADVTAEGLFWFREIPAGDYEIKVLTQYGEELVTTVASVGMFSPPFEIRLPGVKSSRPASGTVSIQQLNHPVSKRVRKLLDSGYHLFEDQRFDDAVARFREAVTDDPGCAQAHADLGLALSKKEAWAGAIEAYRAASALDPRNSILHSNLGVALSMMRRYDEAEREIAKALTLDGTNARAHYVMAGLLLRKPGQLREAVSHLVAAQDHVPSARPAIEKICAVSRVESCPRN